MVGEDAQDPPKSQAQASTVVLEVAVIDEHKARLKEEEKAEDGLVDVLKMYVYVCLRERGGGGEYTVYKVEMYFVANFNLQSSQHFHHELSTSDDHTPT